MLPERQLSRMMVIGEGAMNHLVDVLGPKPAKIALIHTQPVQRHPIVPAPRCVRAAMRFPTS